MVDAPALQRLVGDATDFLATAWGRAPRHVPASPDRSDLVTLLTLDDVDDIVATSGLRAPSFRLVKQGRTLPQSAVTRRVRIGSRPVDDLADVAGVQAAVADGATLVLQGLHRSFPRVATVCRDLERTVTHPVQANAYLTPPVAQGLDLHEDPHDVFAVQTDGAKRWVVHPPGDADPWDLQLTPGDVLYLPAGTRHAAQTIDTPSLHLTIGVRTVAWRALIERAVRDAVGEVADLDRPLPAGWAEEPDLLRERLDGLVHDVADRLREGQRSSAALEREAGAFWSDRPVDRTGGLRDLLQLDALGDGTPLRRRSGATARVARATDGRVELVLVDRVLRLPAVTEGAVHRIVDRAAIRPADLADVMDVASRLVLCRRLVREGLLTVVRDDGVDGG